MIDTGVNPQLFRDSERGRTGWILCSGTSLANVNPANLAGDCIVAVNHNIWTRERLGFPCADYMVCLDNDIARAIDCDPYPTVRKWIKRDAVNSFIECGYHPADVWAGENGSGKSYIQFAAHQGPPEKDNPYIQVRRGTICSALSLAWILGLNPVHILGLDGKADEQGRFHWFDAPNMTYTRDYLHQYGQQRPPFREIANAMIRSGVCVTVNPESDLAGAYAVFA